MTRRSGIIALAGRPNAGKSTFINRALGEKIAIVSDKAQTTRTRILGVYHQSDAQIGFLDLPGIHKPSHQMNREMMRTVRRSLNDADLVFHFIDASVVSGKGDEFAHQIIVDAGLRSIIALNKIDLVNKHKMIPLLESLEQRFSPLAIVPMSAKSGENVDHLIETAIPYLPESEFLYSEDDLTDQPLIFMAQEFIREKILHFTKQEIPHAVAVSIDAFEWDDAESTQFVAARIWVERPSQRSILLGAGGSMIKKIRQAAQRSLRDLLEKKVVLELYVSVEKDWRNKVEKLEALKLRLPD